MGQSVVPDGGSGALEAFTGPVYGLVAALLEQDMARPARHKRGHRFRELFYLSNGKSFQVTTRQKHETTPRQYYHHVVPLSVPICWLFLHPCSHSVIRCVFARMLCCFVRRLSDPSGPLLALLHLVFMLFDPQFYLANAVMRCRDSTRIGLCLACGPTLLL